MSNRIVPLSAVRLRYTELELCGWIGQAAPGAVLQYHRGFLALDREPQADRLPRKDREELVRLCARAHWAAERGFAHLVQRRHGACDYSYLLIARPRPEKVSAPLLMPLASEAA